MLCHLLPKKPQLLLIFHRFQHGKMLVQLIISYPSLNWLFLKYVLGQKMINKIGWNI